MIPAQGDWTMFHNVSAFLGFPSEVIDLHLQFTFESKSAVERNPLWRACTSFILDLSIYEWLDYTHATTVGSVAFLLLYHTYW